jgi:hypothetical protein
VVSGAAAEIAVRHDADHVAPVEHEQVSDAVRSHGVSGLGGAGLRTNRLDVAGHDVVESHDRWKCSFKAKSEPTDIQDSSAT